MCEMINYQLCTELSSAITEKYNHYFSIYREEPPKTYTKGDMIWDNCGIKVFDGAFTIAVLCEFDQHDESDEVYVGVKVLDSRHEFKNLSNYLNRCEPTGGKPETPKQGAHKRWFSWPYWQTIKNKEEGVKLFNQLLEDCIEYYATIFDKNMDGEL